MNKYGVFMQCNTTLQWEWMNHNYTQQHGWIILHHDEQKKPEAKAFMQKQAKIIYSVRKEDSGCPWCLCMMGRGSNGATERGNKRN